MQSVPKIRSFSPSKKQSTNTKPILLSPQNSPSLLKTPFKFKFTLSNNNRFTTTIKEKESQQEHQTTSQSHLKNMAAVQRFKLLATQCGVTQSPTRSPRTSPLVHLRRRKTTLRMLLGRSRSGGVRSPRRDSGAGDRFRLLEAEKKSEKEKGLVKRNSLKELFGSSPPFEMEGRGIIGNSKQNIRESVMVSDGGLTGLQAGPSSPRPVWTGFRYRSLLRRAWRPVLVSIPE